MEKLTLILSVILLNFTSLKNAKAQHQYCFRCSAVKANEADGSIKWDSNNIILPGKINKIALKSTKSCENSGKYPLESYDELLATCSGRYSTCINIFINHTTVYGSLLTYLRGCSENFPEFYNLRPGYCSRMEAYQLRQIFFPDSNGYPTSWEQQRLFFHDGSAIEVCKTHLFDKRTLASLFPKLNNSRQEDNPEGNQVGLASHNHSLNIKLLILLLTCLTLH